MVHNAIQAICKTITYTFHIASPAKKYSKDVFKNGYFRKKTLTNGDFNASNEQTERLSKNYPNFITFWLNVHPWFTVVELEHVCV